MGLTHGLPLTGPGFEPYDVEAEMARSPWPGASHAAKPAPGPAADEQPADEPAAQPEGYLVAMDGGVRIHFLDWGGPAPSAHAGTAPGILLIHGLAQTAWSWAPVARRLRAGAHVVAMDLRGHGLSDAPTDGYQPDQLAEDAIAVAEGAGVLAFADGPAVTDVRGTRASPAWPDPVDARGSPAERPFVVAGHGYGGVVAAWTANALGDRCAGLVLVDGGWTDLPADTGMTPDEWLAVIAEPPEVLASMSAWLADREAFDPASWDADQERAARAEVVETAAGRVKLAIHRHALAASVGALWTYDPASVLGAVDAQVVALAARDDDAGRHLGGLRETAAACADAGRPPIRAASFPTLGHNLMRHVPDAVAAAIRAAADPGRGRAASPGPGTAAGAGSHAHGTAPDTSG
jgi:pimeloyl-ACP methyl ester carboxylesterase